MCAKAGAVRELHEFDVAANEDSTADSWDRLLWPSEILPGSGVGGGAQEGPTGPFLPRWSVKLFVVYGTPAWVGVPVNAEFPYLHLQNMAMVSRRPAPALAFLLSLCGW